MREFMIKVLLLEFQRIAHAIAHGEMTRRHGGEQRALPNIVALSVDVRHKFLGLARISVKAQEIKPSKTDPRFQNRTATLQWGARMSSATNVSQAPARIP
jgi:hypothetical protein